MRLILNIVQFILTLLIIADLFFWVTKLAFAEGQQANKWTILQIANEVGDTLAYVERNPVIDGKLGKDELEEFKEEMEDCKPTSAVQWLTSFFDKVKVIYAFQILNAAFAE